MLPGCQNSFAFIFIGLAAALLTGCERPPAPPATQTVQATPTPVAAMASPTPRLAAALPVSPRPTEPDETPTAAELAQRLRTETESEDRSKTVGELWELGTPEAVEILRRQFFTEREADVKSDIVAGLVAEQKPETRELRFGILSAALAPAQPAEVREVAIAMVTDFDDPRAVALLQNLAQDPNEEIREAAKEAIEARQEKDAK